MSQQQILKILEKLGEREWIGTTELVKMIKLNRSTITRNLLSLREENMVHSRILRKTGSNNRELEHILTWEGRL